MIGDIKDIFSDIKHILTNNLSKVIILVLLVSLIWGAYIHIDTVKSFNKKDYDNKVKCDSLIAVKDAALYEIELKYNKSLTEIKDKNKENIIEYYKEVLSLFKVLSDKQNKIIQE